MNILCIGDIVGTPGCRQLMDKLPKLRRDKQIDVVIANGENAADGNGITPTTAKHIFDSGVDVITLGNHTYRRAEFYDYLDEADNVIRPANFPKGAPGKGFCTVDLGRTQICVINLIGQSFIDSFDSPFDSIDGILSDASLPKIKILDFHAEATGEKKALAYYLDGRISAMFGTHTHVQTADECFLPKGLAYITDVGMTGTVNSVLGVKSELVIKKLKTKLPVRFDYEQEGPCRMDCVMFTCDEKTGRCTKIERISIKK